MARKKRFFRLNSCHHIMLRGVNGHHLFLNDADRMRFCFLLQRATEKFNFNVHAFCLMTNHVHLIIEPTEYSLQDCIHLFSFQYAQYFNRRYNRKGYLYQGRFRSILVDDGLYLRRLIKYSPQSSSCRLMFPA